VTLPHTATEATVASKTHARTLEEREARATGAAMEEKEEKVEKEDITATEDTDVFGMIIFNKFPASSCS